MGKLIGKIIFALLIFPPLYIAMRYFKWSWRSIEKDMKDLSKQ